MTMKKVIVFLLTVALALGGLGFAHAAVTASQDDLLVYPTVQVGDPTALEGLTASFTVGCGEHLRWHTDYPFGGEARTEFVYHRKPLQRPMNYFSSGMDVTLSGGLSSSVSGGSLSVNVSAYTQLLQAVATQTPAGESRTMELLFEEYTDYYVPDYELDYSSDLKTCNESSTLHGFVGGDNWLAYSGSYVALMHSFRFPVQKGHTVSITVDKDGAGRVVGIEFYPSNGPELRFISDISDQGVWFVPHFRDESGAPLPYESPAGHGIYFIPWKHNDIYLWNENRPEPVTLDVKNIRLCYPLDENLRIEHLDIDAEAGYARMLTLQEGRYILTTCDLETGRETARLELLAYDPQVLDATAVFQQEGEYLLVLLQDQIALTDAAGTTLLLTAPETKEQHFGARYFDPATGDLRFDGETLILCDSVGHRSGVFWAAAWRQGALAYYGEYDCSIMSGNKNWYYSYITAEDHPVVLK